MWGNKNGMQMFAQIQASQFSLFLYPCHLVRHKTVTTRRFVDFKIDRKKNTRNKAHISDISSKKHNLPF